MVKSEDLQVSEWESNASQCLALWSGVKPMKHIIRSRNWKSPLIIKFGENTRAGLGFRKPCFGATRRVLLSLRGQYRAPTPAPRRKQDLGMTHEIMVGLGLWVFTGSLRSLGTPVATVPSCKRIQSSQGGVGVKLVETKSQVWPKFFSDGSPNQNTKNKIVN